MRRDYQPDFLTLPYKLVRLIRVPADCTRHGWYLLHKASEASKPPRVVQLTDPAQGSRVFMELKCQALADTSPSRKATPNPESRRRRMETIKMTTPCVGVSSRGLCWQESESLKSVYPLSVSGDLALVHDTLDTYLPRTCAAMPVHPVVRVARHPSTTALVKLHIGRDRIA